MNQAIDQEIGLGLTLHSQGRYRDAVSLYRHVLDRMIAVGSLEYGMRIHTELARNYFYLRDLPAAREHIRLAAQSPASLDERRDSLTRMLVAAEIALGERDYPAAANLLTDVLARLPRPELEPESRLEALALFSRLYHETGEFEKFLSYGTQAMDLVEQIRGQMDIDRQGAAWSAKSNGITSGHISRLLTRFNDTGQEEYFDAAFNEMQKTCSINLRQMRASARGIDAEKSSAVEESFRSWRSGLRRLPFTAVEAENIAERFSGREALIFTGGAATVSNLFQETVRTSRILHIATRGFASMTNPGLTGLALAPEENGGHPGLLTPEDIKAHAFSNERVIISGCDTGQGQLLAGEGIMSLSREFIARGAKAVIATLWPVSDRATALFMNHFYQALTSGPGNPAQALRHAQSVLREDARYAHPFYWSGFVLTVAESAARPVI